MSDEESLDKKKAVELYSQSVSAWFQTSLEKDRSLLYLSSGGIAVLVTLFSTLIKEFSPSPCLKIMFFLSAFSFFLCLLAVLRIFSLNKDIISDRVADRKSYSEKAADRLDSFAIIFFGQGAAFMIVIGVILGLK
jgi:hypothetical protein